MFPMRDPLTSTLKLFGTWVRFNSISKCACYPPFLHLFSSKSFFSSGFSMLSAGVMVRECFSTHVFFLSYKFVRARLELMFNIVSVCTSVINSWWWPHLSIFWRRFFDGRIKKGQETTNDDLLRRWLQMVIDSSTRPFYNLQNSSN